MVNNKNTESRKRICTHENNIKGIAMYFNIYTNM